MEPSLKKYTARYRAIIYIDREILAYDYDHANSIADDEALNIEGELKDIEGVDIDGYVDFHEWLD